MSLKNAEQNAWIDGPGDVLFWLKGDRTKAHGTIDGNIWTGSHYAYEKPIQRKITFDRFFIHGQDICEIHKEKILRFHCVPGIIPCIKNPYQVVLPYTEGKQIELSCTAGTSWNIVPSYYSNAYGRFEYSFILEMEIPSDIYECTWTIEISS